MHTRTGVTLSNNGYRHGCSNIFLYRSIDDLNLTRNMYCIERKKSHDVKVAFTEPSRTGWFRMFQAIPTTNWDGLVGQIGTPEGEEKRGKKGKREEGGEKKRGQCRRRTAVVR